MNLASEQKLEKKVGPNEILKQVEIFQCRGHEKDKKDLSDNGVNLHWFGLGRVFPKQRPESTIICLHFFNLNFTNYNIWSN